MASVILLTTGVPGCGKSYIRAARYLVDSFLPETDGTHISNFPLNPDLIAEDVAANMNITRKGFLSRFFGKRNVIQSADIRKRIILIPDNVIKSWRKEESGPWDYFSDANLQGAHIAIDEIHEIVSYSKSKDYIDKWDEFLGQIRHRGCTFEGITQDVKRVHPCLVNRAGLRLELFPAEDLRDPFFKISLLDWYNLKAAFTGSFHKTIILLEKRKAASGKWVVNRHERYLLMPEYFKYYNSFSASLQEKENTDGTISEDRAPEYEYQKRSRLGLLLWFIWKNFLQLFSRFVIIIIAWWLLLGGGISYLITSFVKSSIKTSPVESEATESSPMVRDHNPSTSTSTQNIVSTNTHLSLSDIYINHKYDPYVPVFISRHYAIMRGGLRIMPGYRFGSGSRYEGKFVKKIDPELRVVILSDDTCLGMHQYTE